MTTIGMLIFDDAEELDFVGPWEVFTMAAKIRDDIRVVTIAERGEAVRCAKGMRVLPDHAHSLRAAHRLRSLCDRHHAHVVAQRRRHREHLPGARKVELLRAVE